MKVGLDTQLGHEYEAVMTALQGSGASSELPPDEFVRPFEPYRDRVLAWAYSEMVSAIRELGAEPLFVLMPVPAQDFDNDEREALSDIIREAGGNVIVLENVYDGYDSEDLRIAEWDDHPNELGHRLIAERLFTEFARQSELGLSKPVELP